LPPSLNSTSAAAANPSPSGATNAHQSGDGFHAYGFDSDTAYLSDLAYKAKFAEQISQDMRVPKRIAIDENEDDIGSAMASEPGYNDNINVSLDSQMNVPSKITLNPMESLTEVSENAGSPHYSPSRHNILDDAQEFVQLQTPPRTLGVLDRIGDEETPRALLADALTHPDVLRRIPNETVGAFQLPTNANQHIPQFLSTNSIDIDALNELLAEEPTSTVIRQQLQSIYRRVISLEKKEEARLSSEESRTKLTYVATVMALISLGISVMALRRTNGYY